MSNEDKLWSTYNQLTINNERALEVVRMVRALYPDEKRSPDDYNFCAVLGVVQDILEKNWDILTSHEEILMELDRCASADET